MTVKIDNASLLAEKLCTGISLFTGAGFSILPDQHGKTLPKGSELAQELIKKFDIDEIYEDDLTYISEQCPKEELDSFLRNRFTVNSYNPLYKVLNKIKINTYVTTNIDNILAKTKKLNPKIVIIDSIQTMLDPACASIPGSINQVKECAIKFIALAKNMGISIVLVGHVNKEGSIAGPKILEHMVDAVLYFEGERIQSYRIIRAIKNRFGSTNEIGVFEMTDLGLCEVPNPSEMLLSGRPTGVSGSCAVCVMEGSRPIIAEIQALVTPTTFPAPRRTSNGVDYNRLCLLLAVLEKRLGLRFSQCDIYLNVVGGLRLDEPSVDLAVALALISSIKDIPLPETVLAMGEIGLAGECRSINELQKRINESYRLGFTSIAVPHKSLTGNIKTPKGVNLVPIEGVYDALMLFKSQE